MASYYAYLRWGGGEHAPLAERMREILEELHEEDDEHPDTWLQDDSGWALAISSRWYATLENVETGEGPWHMLGLDPEYALKLWIALAEGGIDAVRGEPWQEGYPPADPEKLAAIARQVAEGRMRSDREFYNRLGEERPDISCRAEGCTRGAVRFSIFCRPHHFQNRWGRPSPFDD